jgi:ribosomal protein L14
MKAALIEYATNKVVNTIVLEPNAEWEAPSGFFVIFDDNAAINMYYIDGQFVESIGS